MPSAPPRRPLLLALALGLALAVPVAVPPPAFAAETCGETTTTAGYTARVCLTHPDDGVGRGDVPVSARVELTAGASAAPRISKVVFSYRDEYLLSDHDAETGAPVPTYGMTWRSTRMVDGPGVLEAKARLSDDVVVKAEVPVTLANGVVTPAVNSRSFTPRTGTAPSRGQRFRLVAVGDAASGSDIDNSLAQRIATWSPNLLTYLGDVYERGSAFEFDNWYGVVPDPDNPRGFGRFRSITNPTVGNHEYLTPGAAGYFDYWDNVPHYYSYDVAGWHVVTIDSSAEYDQLRPGTAQYDWLAADLGANRARCTIVTMHHPRYAVAAGGGRTGLAQVWQLLADRRVTLALAGHAHHYERWQPLDRDGTSRAGGVTGLVAGAGGHELAAPVLTDPRLATTFTETGALRLDLGPDDVQFAYETLDGQVRDAGTIGCTSTGDPLPPTTPNGLLATATSEGTATLSWNASTDQYAEVAGYRVRRDGVVVATVDAPATSWTDSGLTRGTTYTWTVDAFDTSQNHSAQSAAASTTVPAPSVATTSSRGLLGALRVAPERGKGYRRSAFRTWVDADRDGCDTRAELLLTEAKKAPTRLAPCRITGGRWYSAYDGVGTRKRTRLAVEHHVPLPEAWQSGARRFTAETRMRLANDLLHPASLNVATKKVLRARGSAEPQSWLPPRAATRCAYVAEWVAVKWRWRLAVDKAERRFLVKRLRRCDWPEVVAPTRAVIRRR